MTWYGTAPSGRILTLNVNGSVAKIGWEEARGDVSGVLDNLIVIALQQNPVSSEVPSSGFVLAWDGSSWSPASPSVLGSGSTHELLSATHPDTIAVTPPTRGDLVRASAAQKWTRFPMGASGQIVSNDGDDVEWIEHGIFTPQIVTAGASVSLSPSSRKVIINKAVAGIITVSLPASPKVGQEILVKDGKGDAKSNNITILAPGKTIDGNSSIVMINNYQAYSLLFNGTEWNIV